MGQAGSGAASCQGVAHGRGGLPPRPGGVGAPRRTPSPGWPRRGVTRARSARACNNNGSAVFRGSRSRHTRISYSAAQQIRSLFLTLRAGGMQCTSAVGANTHARPGWSLATRRPPLRGVQKLNAPRSTQAWPPKAGAMARPAPRSPRAANRNRGATPRQRASTAPPRGAGRGRTRIRCLACGWPCMRRPAPPGAAFPAFGNTAAITPTRVRLRGAAAPRASVSYPPRTQATRCLSVETKSDVRLDPT